MGEGLILREVRDGVTLLTLNRPHRLNAITAEVIEDLHSALTGATADPGTRAVVITGAGRAFSAGGDVQTLTDWQGLAPPQRVAEFGHAADLAMLLAQMPCPVVAAVNGFAAGAGFDLALGSDICIAVESASFMCGFTAMGLVPDMGGGWLLPRIVGLSRARRLLLGCERIDAKTAQDWGIVATVVKDGDLLDAAVVAAARMAAAATRPAFAEAKRALLDGSRGYAEALHIGARVQSILMDTAEHRERAERFRKG